ncbi:MAG TPA: preprotein translocase subunit SecA [Candidatus Thioglobus sp.]|jgi:preprotein translocase subunit SecA|nr:preprotein translocase subunit SecA [Candidatus Thioglobus sp.]
MSIINKVVAKVVGSRNERLVKKYAQLVGEINAFEAKLQTLTDEELGAKTQDFRDRLAQSASLDDILSEAFAVVREAGQRVLGIRHYDVQLIGGMVLNQGCIAEMGTGEGKTLVATLPAYLNSLCGEGVHVVTVNDYLATRDAEWMGKIYNFLGLTVGTAISGMTPEDKVAAYACDITYATNNELGFDYLRDNMAFSVEQKAQKKRHFAIIDEVDSILIDEARTPLVISGPTDDHAAIYEAINKMTPQFTEQLETGEGKEVVVNTPGDFTLNKKHKQAYLTDDGHIKAEELLIEAELLAEGASLYDSANIMLMQHLLSGLRAHNLFHIDDEYIVKDDEVIIVDEFTGRTMEGRRWSEGLHQALEAKEGVSIKRENQTLAGITYQNFFRLYEKLSGMTGTAETEAVELHEIYGLEVVVVPANTKSARIDESDLIFGTTPEKFDAIAADVKKCQEAQQPVLVGTSSIETSEAISALLKKHKISHEVLNAKQHQREAEIIANAGAPGAVTIATNMAGRGTDIVLGGRPSEGEEQTAEWLAKHAVVIKAGGLHIIGTERNESRRVDNQLRGRSARQGDIGSTRFYLSLEDSLMQIFASEKTAGMMKKLGMKEGEALEHSWLNRTIENAQRKVEGMHYDARKHLLEYDDVANDQRKVIYGLRNELMDVENVKERFIETRESVIGDLFDRHVSATTAEEDWDVDGLQVALKADFGVDMPLQKTIDSGHDVDKILKIILDSLAAAHQMKEDAVGSETMRMFEKAVMLRALDHFWKEHLAAMDYLRQSVNLRGYGQKNPVQEYKRESFEMFAALLDTINIEMIKALCRVNVEPAKEDPNNKPAVVEKPKKPMLAAQQPKRVKKVGRNDPCPCGSGKKFKQCHG